MWLWHNERHETEQSSEIDLHIQRQLIFQQRCEGNSVEKEESLQQVERGNLLVRIGKKKNFDPHLTSHMKIKPKWRS